jgi:hypothetical protein
VIIVFSLPRRIAVAVRGAGSIVVIVTPIWRVKVGPPVLAGVIGKVVTTIIVIDVNNVPVVVKIPQCLAIWHGLGVQARIFAIIRMNFRLFAGGNARRQFGLL